MRSTIRGEESTAVTKASSRSALRALRETLGGRVVEAIADDLTNRDPQRRAAAIYALVELKSWDALPDVAQLLGDPSGDVRIAVATFMDTANSTEAQRILRKLAADQDPAVAMRADVGLGRSSP